MFDKQSRCTRLAILRRSSTRIGRYGEYLVELLRGEGLRPKFVLDLDNPKMTDLAALLETVETVVVSACLLKRQEAKQLARFVKHGGRLVVIRPSTTLRSELGLVVTTRSIEGFIASGTEHPYARALFGHTIAGLTISDVYQHDFSTPTVSTYLQTTDGARVSLAFEFAYGAGQVAVFGFDVAWSVAILRQGNPSRAETLSLGTGGPLRPTDLLEGAIPPEYWLAPQADLISGLLVNAIIGSTGDLLPRVWYFPQAVTTTVSVHDSDDDWSTVAEFDCLISSAKEAGILLTFYLMLGHKRTVLTPERVTELRLQGHSFGIHHDGTGPELNGEDIAFELEDIIRKDIETFREQFGGTPLVNRNHCIIWKGYDDLPRLFAELGLIMEFNYENHVSAWLGYMAGSGRPLKYVSEIGEVIPLYQQSTHVFDDLLVEKRLTTYKNEEVVLFRQFVQRSQFFFHGAIVMQSHPVSFAGYSKGYFEACWKVLRDLEVPALSAEQWALFIKARDQSEIHWSDEIRTRLVLNSDPPESRFSVALADSNRQVSAILSEGVSLPLQHRTLAGVPHVFFDWPYQQNGEPVLKVDILSGD